MTSISIHLNSGSADALQYMAIAGNRRSFGRTRGEALDALVAEWGDKSDTLEIVIESLKEGLAADEFTLKQVNNVWVISGGFKDVQEGAFPDLVAEAREERDQFLSAPYEISHGSTKS